MSTDVFQPKLLSTTGDARKHKKIVFPNICDQGVQ